MDIKSGTLIAGSFAGGALIGALVSYFITKKYCDEVTQMSVDQMKESFKKEIEKMDAERAKNDEAKTVKNEDDNEDNYIRKDKPSITEMSSIYNYSRDNNVERTNYSDNGFSEIKKKIKDLKKEVEEKKEQEKKSYFSVIDYSDYIMKCDADYIDKSFIFNTDDETWEDDSSTAEYEPDDLPFDPDIIQWDGTDQCYICDESSHVVYSLRKV